MLEIATERVKSSMPFELFTSLNTYLTNSLDIRIKIIFVVIYTIAFYIFEPLFSIICSLAVLVLLYFCGKQHTIKAVLISITFMVLLISVTGAIQFTSTERSSIVQFSIPSFFNSLYVCSRLYASLLISLMLTEFSKRSDLILGLNYILSPFKKISAPVGDIVMMVVIALSAIPEATLKLDLIKRAQNARGARVGQNRNPVKRVLSYTAVFTPLIISMFRYGDELADALFIKHYSGNLHDTKLKFNCTNHDLVFILFSLLFLVILYFILR